MNLPLDVRPRLRQEIVDYFERNPIRSHVRADENSSTLVELFTDCSGKKDHTKPSSVRQVRDLEGIEMRDLKYPKKHDGQSYRWI